jgi:hypothetical protein
MDYLLQFTDEPTAQAALPQLYSAANGWNESLCIPNISVAQQTGTTTETDPDTGDQILVPVMTPDTGWFIRIAGTPPDGTTPFDQTGWTCSPVFAQ